MQGLKKYCQLVADVQQDKEETPPDVLFRLYYSLELQLIISESDIEKWAIQIKSLEERIQSVKKEEEPSSQMSSELEEGKGEEGEAQVQTNKQNDQKHPCSHADCHLSFSKDSTLRCHEWLNHRKQSIYSKSFILHLQHNDSQYHY